ncbi:hypothetical protein RJ639_011741 [Escallonia herrerae]|uniref:Integrase catalytic domain-containing protein n=1 Tax=Escallonia herrerae TaxID=1293975 RepID=A0AA88VP75_9ASTE|nr:hypothetical protein RJ639_011741 [Escallonia herrerae]
MDNQTDLITVIRAMQQSIEKLQAAIENPPPQSELLRPSGTSETPKQTSHNQHVTQMAQEFDDEWQNSRSRRHEDNYYEAHSTRNTYANTGGNRAECYSNAPIIIGRPFSDEINLFPTLLNFKMPPCESYDGTWDPMEHLACFTSGMNLHLVPDQIMCWDFPVTLKGAAHVWFQCLAPRSITCWAQLAEAFRSNFLTSRVQRKNSSALALFRITQGRKESLKSYYTRFNSEKLLIDHLDPGVTFAAMARGVRPGTPLTRADRLSSSSRKAYARQVNLTQGPAKQTKASTSLEFDNANLDGVSLPHDDALIITLRIDAFQIKCILVDTGSSVDIIFKDAFNQMGISDNRIKPISSPLYGFTGASAPVKGIAPLTVVVGAEPRQAEVHEGICGQHLGGHALAHKVLRQGYYWPTMQQDVMSYTKKCDACQRFSSIPRQAPSPLSTLSSPIPFAMWGMDILGLFPLATAQRKFVIVSIDYFTKWVEAEALASITERKCEDFFWRAVVCCFGIPRVLIIDNGKQFDNPIFQTFYINLSIEQQFTSVTHPQTNGQTEVTNRTLLQGIKKKLDGAKGLWVYELHKILWAYNTTTRTSIGETPLSLLFGTEALIPFEIGLPSLHLTTYDPVQNEEALRANLDLLDERHEQAVMCLATYQWVRPRIFRVGDLVFRRIETSAPRHAIGKQVPNWDGPYKMVKLGGPGAYHLKDMDRKTIPHTWNATNLRLYYA